MIRTIIIFLFSASACYSQNSGTVIYKYKFNGNELTDRPPLAMNIYEKTVIIKNQTNTNPNSEETQYISYHTGKTHQVAKLKTGEHRKAHRSARGMYQLC